MVLVSFMFQKIYIDKGHLIFCRGLVSFKMNVIRLETGILWGSLRHQ